MSNEEEITRFVAFCIEQYKRRHGGDCESAYDCLSNAGALRFLADNFNVEHCLDPDMIVDDIDRIISRSRQEAVK